MINVSFSCLQSRANQAGFAPVQMWVNVGKGDRKSILLPVKFQPSKFNAKKKGEAKSYCDSVRAKIESIAVQLDMAGKKVSADNIIALYRGKTESAYLLSNLCKDYMAYLATKVDVTMTMIQYNKYRLSIEDYLQYQGNKEIRTINKIDIDGYSTSLYKKYKASTVAGYLKRVKTMFSWAVGKRLIESNPYEDMKIDSGMVEVEPLMDQEILLLESKTMPVERLEKVKDMFLFLVYTSLSYADLKAFNKEDIRYDGNIHYITKERIKTGVKFVIPLNDKAIAILEKYDYNLPVISNMKMNEYLKSVQEICGIKKKLHCHLARHTALTNFLNEGKPLEVVSMIAGHSSTQMTKHYASVREQTVLSYFKK